MFAFKEILAHCKANKLRIGQFCEQDLISKGYVHNDIFGWEKLEVLKRFNISPSLKAVPAKAWKELDKQGRETGKDMLVPTNDWLDYTLYKKSLIKDEFIASKIKERVKQPQDILLQEAIALF